MTEANFPSNQQHSPELPQSDASNWYTGWGDFDASSRDDQSPAAQPASSEEWQTLNPPGAIDLDALERRSEPPAAKVAHWSTRTLQPDADLATWNESAEATPPNVEELISLIQELNQCNSALLDRVSQLEDALERQSGSIGAVAGSGTSTSQADASAQEQIAYLFNQLEFAHQTSQRQQILIETLTEQLESSQERVAQLERECALTQQRYNEQSHQLAYSEDSCRDLRTRLHRQQRYTLQFKAALEKCLEVPAPSYESPNEIVAATPAQPWYESQSSLMPPFLPKVARIQPWSSPDGGLLSFDSPDATPIETTPSSQAEKLDSGADAIESSFSESIVSPSLPPMVAPIAQLPVQPETPTISYNVKAKAAANPTLEQAIDDALHPIDASEALPSDGSLLQLPTIETPVVEINPGEAEAALWQDLARLIEVSADDVLKASLAGDFSAFETTNPGTPAVTPQAETVAVNSPVVIAESVSAPDRLMDSTSPDWSAEDTSDPKRVAAKQDAIAADLASETASGFTPTSSGPSPIVYPLRPHKKLASLAAVDLPTFPR